MTVSEECKTGRSRSPLDDEEKLADQDWIPYFRNIPGVHESGFGLFEVGYVGALGSVMVVGNTGDSIIIHPPARGKIALDHKVGCDRIQIAPHDCHGLFPRWKGVGRCGAELVWEQRPAGFVPRPWPDNGEP